MRGLYLLIILSMLLGTACGGVSPSVGTPQAPLANRQEYDAPAEHEKGTPTPQELGLPLGSQAVPVAVPTPPEVTFWETPIPPPGTPSQSELIAHQGYVLCPDEIIEERDGNDYFVCPGNWNRAKNEMVVVGSVMAPTTMLDTPLPGVADAVVVVAIIAAGATSLIPISMMAKDPGLLPDLPQGWDKEVPIPSDNGHLVNHPGGAYNAKKKLWGWYISMKNLLDPFKKPDFCGQRQNDGALIFLFLGEAFSNLGGKIYKNLAVIVNQGGESFSTVLFDVEMKDGKPNSRNSSGNDFDQFLPLPPERCKKLFSQNLILR